MQKTGLEVVLLPKPASTLPAAIPSAPLTALPLFCLTTPLAISSVPCLLSSLNAADWTLRSLRCLEPRTASHSCGNGRVFQCVPATA